MKTLVGNFMAGLIFSLVGLGVFLLVRKRFSSDKKAIAFSEWVVLSALFAALILITIYFS